jgi:DNA-binding transcriptional LysR family regulator
VAIDVHLRNLRYFVAVAEELHFSRAAERLHLSQPALSKQIRQLERELRFPLFNRDRRRVELTAAGEALLPAAKQILADWDTALATATQRASEEAKLLHVGFQTSVGGSLYQDVAERFAALRPEWRLALRSHLWSDPTGGLADGSADVAFVWLPTGAEDEIEVVPLRSERKYVALPDGHRLTRRRAVEMADLLDEPFVALPADAGALREHWLALDDRGSHPVRIGAEASTVDEAFEAVTTGRCVVLLAEGNVSVYDRPGVVCLPVIGVQPSRLAIAWRRGERRAAVREFVAAAVEVAAENERQTALEAG